MKRRVLGKIGFEITEIGFGAWAIGGRGYGEVPTKQAERAVETYLAGGGNFIDTAIRYGRSEQILGEVIGRAGVRAKVFLASKTPHAKSEDDLPEIKKDCEASLRSLKTDYIDLYYLHAPPDEYDLMQRVLDEFDKLKDEGKIRSIGASIKGPDVTERTVALCKQYVDTGRIDAIQLIYSIFRQLNCKSIRYAREHKVGIVARTVLESGFLTGKYRAGVSFSPEDHRRRWKGDHLNGILEQVPKLASWAVKEPYSNLAQVALRFALDNDGISAVIPGGRNTEQVLSNLAIDGLPPIRSDILSRLYEEFANFTEKANTG